MDWNSIASLATALGTIVLAVATFASVRSANRSARAAELSLLAALRPLMVPSQPQDAEQKVMFADRKWVKVSGATAVAQVENGVIYLAASLRNVGPGIGVLHGWKFYPRPVLGGELGPAPLAEFRRLTRDLYVPPGGLGFWQGAFRDENEPGFGEARAAIEARESLTLEILYGDHDGGQRMITRFGLQPRPDGAWFLSASRHWNIDRPDPR